MEPKVIFRTWSDAEAALIHGLLQSYGIPCSVVSDITHSILPFAVDGLGEIRLSVPSSAAEEAERILAEHQAPVREGDPLGESGCADRTPMESRMTEILARAPTRIDLAGGTLDLWPIYLLEEGASTINAAIDLDATARIAPRSDSLIRLRSIDQDVEEEYPSLGEVRWDGRLGFLARLVAQLPPPSGLEITTECAAPAGSGLGGSSALGIAVAGGLARHRGEAISGDALIGLGQSVETQVLRVPTGVQDYYPALYGGVLALRYGARGTRAEAIPVDLEKLEERLVLCFSGSSRSSGVSNWDMFKRYLDAEPAAVEGIRRVAAATRGMEAALRANDVEGAASALGEEWAARKTLSSKVTSEAIESQMAAARGAGALAGKVCGAGGGGCLVFLTRPGRKRAVQEALENKGARVLPVRIRREGLRLEELDLRC